MNYSKKQKILKMTVSKTVEKRVINGKFNLKPHRIASQRTNKRKLLYLRSDVVNKTLVRAVKRFYFDKFKSLEMPMVRKRFINIKSSNILAALAKF